MCGITGFAGKNAPQMALKCLQKLEYRGYDSSGLSGIDNGHLFVFKAVGKIDNLKQKLTNKNLDSKIAIAHTRWATHGKVSIENAHPHLSQDGNVCLVHNGIIENFVEMKKMLKNKTLNSQTDTEVFANFLAEKTKESKDLKNFLSNFKTALDEIKGSYSFGIIVKSFGEKIFFAKKKSPLTIGIGSGFCAISSDINSFEKSTKKVVALCDGDYGYIENNTYKIFHNKQKVKRKETPFFAVEKELTKGKYQTFMEKEINEGEKAVLKTLSFLEKENFNKLCYLIKTVNKIFVVGCGTALHAGEIFGRLLEKFFNLNVKVCFASEFLYENKKLNNSLCFFISQSGETADTISCAVLAKNKGAKTVAITNSKQSTITKICDINIFTQAGVEVSVASTKAYMAQLAVIYYLLTVFSNAFEKNIPFLQKDLKKVLRNNNKNNLMLEEISNKIKDKKSLFFVGRGIDYLVAKEGALKLKEVSYIHCEAFAGGELKHGSLALIDDSSFAICVLTQKKLLSKMMSNIIEMKSRGAKIVLISQFLNLEGKVDYFVHIPRKKCDLMPFCAVLSLQKLALFCAQKKGLNPDMPRNLAKSVTVE